MFCSWGAEEYGLIGSVEYVQVYSLFIHSIQKHDLINEPYLGIRESFGSSYRFIFKLRCSC